MKGIENLKTGLSFIIGLGERVEKVTAEDSAGGKKIVGTEWLGSLGLLVGVPGLLKAVPEFIPEIKDLDAEELKEVIEFLMNEFDLEKDKIEEAIERGVKVLVEIRAIAGLFKKV